eukprot:SAG31_NODE_9537_length_1261_cov_0.910576_1_plen_55_part_10
MKTGRTLCLYFQMLEVIILHAYSFIPIFLELCTVHHRSSGVRSEVLVLLAYGTAY